MPQFLKGADRSAMRIALLEANRGDEFRRVRGWKVPAFTKKYSSLESHEGV